MTETDRHQVKESQQGTRHHEVWRARWLPLLLIMGILAAMLPNLVEAKPRHNQGDRARFVEARDAVSRHRRGGVHGEIVGGTVVPQGTYTFATFITVDYGERRTACTGSLIAPQFVLTAGHCVVNKDTGTPATPAQFSLVIGQSHAFPPPPAANVFSVAQVFRHPGFAASTAGNDVAVLKLTQAVPASLSRPIALVAANDTRYEMPGQRVVAAGWGLTVGGGELSPDLRQISTTTISDVACDDRFSAEIDDATVICTQVPSKNICQGDSGGPLFVAPPAGAAAIRHTARAGRGQLHRERKKKHHHPTPPPPPPPPPVTDPLLIGVTSFSAVGCAPGTASGYAQLSAPSIHDFVTNALQN